MQKGRRLVSMYLLNRRGMVNKNGVSYGCYMVSEETDKI